MAAQNNASSCQSRPANTNKHNHNNDPQSNKTTNANSKDSRNNNQSAEKSNNNDNQAIDTTESAAFTKKRQTDIGETFTTISPTNSTIATSRPTTKTYIFEELRDIEPGIICPTFESKPSSNDPEPSTIIESSSESKSTIIVELSTDNVDIESQSNIESNSVSESSAISEFQSESKPIKFYNDSTESQPGTDRVFKEYKPIKFYNDSTESQPGTDRVFKESNAYASANAIKFYNDSTQSEPGTDRVFKESVNLSKGKTDITSESIKRITNYSGETENARQAEEKPRDDDIGIAKSNLSNNKCTLFGKVDLNENGKNGQRIILCPEQENNISAHLNLLNQKQQNSNLLNTITEESLSATSTDLDLTKITTTTTETTTTPSTKMMEIQLPGDEYQDLNGALQIAAVEELMAPACLDDYFIETNNISDFDITKGTYKLQELNEMTINQMNVNYAGQQLQLLPENGQEQEQQEQLLKEIPGEENIYNILRMPYSEELVTLTQPSTIIGHETTSLESESLFTQYIDDELIADSSSSSSSDNNSSSSYIEVSPGSPLPTESDCIATSELHNYKYMDDNCHDELVYDLEFSPLSIEPSPITTEEHQQQPTLVQQQQQASPVCQSNSSADEEALDLEQILKQLEAASQQQQQQQQQQNTNTTLKRNSDHFGALPTKIAKKSRMNIPMTRLVTDTRCEDTLTTIKVPDTPEVCDMVDEWLTEDFDVSTHSLSSSPTWSGTSFAPPDFVTDSFTLIEPKYENPPSIASSYICEEPLYATPSPSNSSSSTVYSTNPNSPAVSQYGSANGFKRKPRGRPPKQHSDLPNPEILRNLPESERKRIEDRCKNNEASRQSRQKNKEKQMILLAEEEHEEQRNAELKNKMRHLEKQHQRLKNILYRKLGNTN
ncbi:ras guanine nucleotide exchange factor B [Episyrphus balteatus]|uniref:ras guanine nucleotide exchange factor B n=1 Tax=Episyrphus balteatus TaxID=286459 RepID=UPI0024867D94|nr:ras guanine nucleotide exchange factor B [Episyrphus balteatus]